MEMHERSKKERARSEEILTVKKIAKPEFIIKPKPIPDFKKLQEEFFDELERKKLEAKCIPTKVKPPTFHVTKVNLI
jgi:hypothetical protein